MFTETRHRVSRSASEWARRVQYEPRHTRDTSRDRYRPRWRHRSTVRRRLAQRGRWFGHPLNWLRATVAGTEEALVGGGLAFVGLAGLEAGSETEVSGVAATVVTLLSAGVAHVVSETNARAMEQDAERSKRYGSRAHDHSHEHGHAYSHAHHGQPHKSPLITAVSSVGSYVAGIFIPLTAYMASGGSAAGTMVVTGTALYGFGAYISRYTDKSSWRLGLRQLLSGGTAMAATFAVSAAWGSRDHFKSVGNWLGDGVMKLVEFGRGLLETASEVATNPTVATAGVASVVSLAGLAYASGSRKSSSRRLR